MYCNKKPQYKINDKIYTANRYATVTEGIIKSIRSVKGKYEYIIENKYKEKKVTYDKNGQYQGDLLTGKITTGLLYSKEADLFERI